MKCHVPVDLLGVEPRVWGNLETVQAIALFAAGVAALAALAGRLPMVPAVLIAGPLAGYALLDVGEQPVRRLVPRIVRHGLKRAAADDDPDASLWLEAPRYRILDQIIARAHCLLGKMARGRYGNGCRRT